MNPRILGIFVIMVAAMLALSTGCGKKGGDDKGDKAKAKSPTSASGSFGCDKKGVIQECEEYHKGAPEKPDVVKSACKQLDGKFIDGACPTDGEIARCSWGKVKGKVYYKGNDLEESEKNCTDFGGKFTKK